jgi:hypothetical protein
MCESRPEEGTGARAVVALTVVREEAAAWET